MSSPYVTARSLVRRAAQIRNEGFAGETQKALKLAVNEQSMALDSARAHLEKAGGHAAELIDRAERSLAGAIDDIDWPVPPEERLAELRDTLIKLGSAKARAESRGATP